MKSPLNFRELAKNPSEYQAEFQRLDHLGNLVGAKFISIDRDQIIYHYEVKPEHYNPNGFLHGGALYTVMDSSQGAFVHFILDEKFEIAVTGTATIRYEAPLREGTVKIRTFLDKTESRKLFVKSVATQDSKTVATLDEIWIALEKK